jgi:hypothetical protein
MTHDGEQKQTGVKAQMGPHEIFLKKVPVPAIVEKNYPLPQWRPTQKPTPPQPLPFTWLVIENRSE